MKCLTKWLFHKLSFDGSCSLVFFKIFFSLMGPQVTVVVPRLFFILFFFQSFLFVCLCFVVVVVVVVVLSINIFPLHLYSFTFSLVKRNKYIFILYIQR